MSQLSARTVFALAHKQGDILREGWQNLIVCILQLLKAKLLPPALTEVFLCLVHVDQKFIVDISVFS